MTRAEEIAAALKLCSPLIEEWNYGRGYLEEPRHCEAGDALCRHINTLARLLRESQPEPAPAVGEDEALLARWEFDKYNHGRPMSTAAEVVTFSSAAGDALAARLRAALADVARLTEERDRCERYWHSSSEWRSRISKDLDEALAALSAAEQEKKKAVSEEREACAVIADGLSGERPSVDDYTYGRYCAADDVAHAIRARAGRNDA